MDRRRFFALGAAAVVGSVVAPLLPKPVREPLRLVIDEECAWGVAVHPSRFFVDDVVEAYDSIRESFYENVVHPWEERIAEQLADDPDVEFTFR